MELESGESFSNIGFQTRHNNTVTQWPHFVPHDERLPYRKNPIANFDSTVSSVQSNNNCKTSVAVCLIMKLIYQFLFIVVEKVWYSTRG
jgi:hypothetical protein